MLGKRLRDVREENEKTQGEIAKFLGKGQNTISSWETGRTYPRLEDLNKLCTLYGCTYEYLTGTRLSDSGDITLDDIIKRVLSMDLSSLYTLKETVDSSIEREQRIEEMKNREAEMQRRLEAYQREIERLKNEG